VGFQVGAFEAAANNGRCQSGIVFENNDVVPPTQSQSDSGVIHENEVLLSFFMQGADQAVTCF
jgi:hypothetical protein